MLFVIFPEIRHQHYIHNRRSSVYFFVNLDKRTTLAKSEQKTEGEKIFTLNLRVKFFASMSNPRLNAIR